MDIEAVYWKPIMQVVKPALPFYQSHTYVLNKMSQQLSIAEMYFNESDENDVSLR